MVMSVTGEEAIQPSSDSFWEIGKYKRTVKRAEDGFRLSEDLIAMVQERIAIEKKYAKSLKVWSQKWAQHVEKVSFCGKGRAVELSALSVMVLFQGKR